MTSESRKTATDIQWEHPDEIMFDDLARRAASSLRAPAPAGDLATVVAKGRHLRLLRRAAAATVAGALVVSVIAVVSNHRDSSVPVAPVVNTTVPQPSPTDPVIVIDDKSLNDWFLDYTGNPVGPVSGQPVKFGVIVPGGLYQLALNATETLLNEEVGGVGGRPIALEYCRPLILDCAEKFANDPAIVAVIENSATNESIGPALAGRKPLHTSNSRSGTTGVTYYPMLAESVTGMALEAKRLTKPGGRILVIDAVEEVPYSGPSSALRIPDVAALLPDRTVMEVKATREANLVETIRASGMTKPDAVVLAAPPGGGGRVFPHGHDVCLNLSDALDELQIRSPVVAVLCDPHEGWYEVGIGFNRTTPSLQSGALPILQKAAKYGKARGWKREGTGDRQEDTTRDVGALLAIVRIINELGGPDNATPSNLDRAMRQFAGPVPLGAGPLDCTAPSTGAARGQPGNCVRYLDVHRLVSGSWTDETPVDLTT